MSELMEKLVREVVALRERVNALEVLEQAAGISDHGALDGLEDDDHTQYQQKDSSGNVAVSGDTRIGGGLYVGGVGVDPAAGCIELGEITTPSAPGSDIARWYAADTNGRTNLFMKGSDGQERAMSVGQGARVYHTEEIAIPNATLTPVSFNSEIWDSDGCHSTTSNNHRVYVRTAGIYVATAHLTYTSNGTGMRHIRLKVNGNVVAVLNVNAVTADHTSMSIATIWSCSVNDYWELEAYQTSGGALNLRVSPSPSHYSPELAMVRVG